MQKVSPRWRAKPRKQMSGTWGDFFNTRKMILQSGRILRQHVEESFVVVRFFEALIWNDGRFSFIVAAKIIYLEVERLWKFQTWVKVLLHLWNLFLRLSQVTPLYIKSTTEKNVKCNLTFWFPFLKEGGAVYSEWRLSTKSIFESLFLI